MRLRLNLLLKDHPLQPLPAATATVGLARAPSSKASFTSLDTIPDTQPPPQPPVPSPAPSPNPPRAPLIIGNLPLPVPPATQPPTDPTEPSEPSDAPDARSEGSAPNLDWRTFGLGALVQRALDPDPRVRAAAANAYPGDDPRSTVKRWAVRLLAGVGGGPSGAHSLEAGPLGNGLRQLAAGDYEALKKGSGGLMRQLDETGEAGRGGRCLLKYYKEAGVSAERRGEGRSRGRGERAHFSGWESGWGGAGRGLCVSVLEVGVCRAAGRLCAQKAHVLRKHQPYPP